MKKVASILKMLGTAGPSNLLFRFSDSYIGHLNNTLTEVAIMLTLPVLESYNKMKTLLKVSGILVEPPQNGSSLKNCTEMYFSI